MPKPKVSQCQRCAYLNMYQIFKLYPTTIRHYNGCITQRKSDKFQARIVHEKLHHNKTFSSYEEAFNDICLKNIEYELPIKNIIYDMNDYCEVCLTHGQHMIIDKDDIILTQKHVLYADRKSNGFYARSGHNPCFQNFVMSFKQTEGLIVDHINGNGLDNRKSNLRIVSMSTQQRNIKSRNNTSGVLNLCYRESTNSWRVMFRYNKKNYETAFSCNKHPNARELAIQWLGKKKAEIIPESERITRDLLQP